MPDFPELLLTIRPGLAGAYAIEGTMTLPHEDLKQHVSGTATFDVDALDGLHNAMQAYGQLLYRQLLGDESVRTFVSNARDHVKPGQRLRVRLWLTPEASELENLRWESLWPPGDPFALLADERIVFSRYLSSNDWRSMELRARADLRALVMIANPGNLSEFRMAPVRVEDEWALAHEALAPIGAGDPVTRASGPASLDNLLKHLREGYQNYDILYLVCHGARGEGQTWLFMEDADGQVAQVSAAEFVRLVSRLPAPPRLIVLAACHSAAADGELSGDGRATSSLGSRLAEEGIPAVIAMQGRIAQATAKLFMPVFFTQLVDSGEIDVAMTLARLAVRGLADAWVPALFMRLDSGRIWWYDAGIRGGDKGAFEDWRQILASIESGKCTPVLGPGLYEFLLGSPREVARHWAEVEEFPMNEHVRDDLPQVAQYLAIRGGPGYLWDRLEEYLRDKMNERYAAILAADQRGLPLDDLVKAVGAHRRADNPLDPHRILAQLPLPIFLTANSDNLISDSLREVLVEAGSDQFKQPQIALCPWNAEIKRANLKRKIGTPTIAEPLVYHLLGRLTDRNSLVLTEDDYFEYLVGTATNRNAIPERVRRAQVDTSLLFIGFELDSWNFRVLFRSIMRKEGGGDLRSSYRHVAVQLSPQSPRISNPASAREYLEKEFGTEQISIFWGNVDDFAKELWKRWTGRTVRSRDPR